MAPKILYNHSQFDASENLWLRRELENVRAQAFDVKFPAFKARQFLPIDHSVGTGAETTTFSTMESFAQTKIGGDYHDEAPRVDVKMTDETLRIRPLTAAYGYSMQEVRNGMQGGRSLPQMKADASRKAIEEGLDNILLLGDSAWSLAGLFTLSGTTTQTIAAGALGTVWGVKTAAEKVQDLHNLVNKVVEDTQGIELPDTLILPLTAFNDINQTRMGDGSDVTALKYFLATNEYITSVESSIKLESNAGWTGRRMVVYVKSPSHLNGIIPQEYEQLSPQERNFETIINCHARCAGVEVYYPKAVGYQDTF